MLKAMIIPFMAFRLPPSEAFTRAFDHVGDIQRIKNILTPKPRGAPTDHHIGGASLGRHEEKRRGKVGQEFA